MLQGYLNAKYHLSINDLIKSIEYWSNSIVSITYYEEYESYVHQTCTRTYECNCSTDSNGMKTCSTCTETYDCSYCDKTPEQYVALLNDGSSHDISKTRALKIMRHWNETERFIDMQRNITYWGYCGEDGDAYRYTWDGEYQSHYNFTREKNYVNKIKVSNTVFSEVEHYDEKLTYDYPNVFSNYQKSLIGKTNDTLEHYLQFWNGQHGKNLQIKYFVFIWPSSTPTIAVEHQKSRFFRCNKNEFILCLFIDENGVVEHLDYITWSLSDFTPLLSLENKKYDEVTIETSKFLEQNWQRLEFSQFDYIQVEPRGKHYILTFLATMLASILLFILFSKNQHDKYLDFE